MIKQLKYYMACAVAALAVSVNGQNNVAEEVAWVVGDEPIFKSDIEEQYLNLQQERTPIDGNPYCVIPEKMNRRPVIAPRAYGSQYGAPSPVNAGTT